MATIKDIAKVAGVSVTTVSRALNGYSDVNEKTRKKIKAVAKELEYSPNVLARSLVVNKTKTIGLIVSELSRSESKDNFTFKVLRGINDCAGELGYDLVLFSTSPAKQKEKTYTQLCRERRVDGAIIQGIRMDDPYLEEVLQSDIPCVLVDIPVHSESVGYVTTDNVFGAKKAVKHLLDNGHREIAMINGHDQAFVSRERLEGYRLALAEAGIRYREDLVVNGEFREAVAADKTRQLLKQHPKITAIFCSSDLMALGSMNGARSIGYEIPEDLSIVGYDDNILAPYANPPLTTIAQNEYQMGFEAARLLVGMLEQKKKSHAKILDSELVIRNSTATVTNKDKEVGGRFTTT
ncbi:MAG TPA: LacI family DNA-binding transcriptional regulator [Bacillales bacterium]|nr:LacI family DNA-binding transcriptional regulator [Bacillales bacterium]